MMTQTTEKELSPEGDYGMDIAQDSDFHLRVLPQGFTCHHDIACLTLFFFHPPHSLICHESLSEAGAYLPDVVDLLRLIVLPFFFECCASTMGE